MDTDETGNSVILALIVAGALIGGGFGALSAVINRENVLVGCLVGFVSGAIAGGFGAAKSIFLIAIVNGAVGFVSEIAKQRLNGTEWQDINWGKVGFNAGVSFVAGAFGSWLGNWAKVSASLDDFCRVGFSVITDSASNSIGLGVNPLLEQLFGIEQRCV